MYSEQLRRFHGEQSLHSVLESKAQESAEIARQVEELLSRGGEIQQVRSYTDSVDVVNAFNAGPVVDPMSGIVLGLPPREVVDGVAMITMARVSALTGRSKTFLDALTKKGEFPEHADKVRRQRRWKESDVLAWVERNSNA